jgi:hypothetical protein
LSYRWGARAARERPARFERVQRTLLSVQEAVQAMRRMGLRLDRDGIDRAGAGGDDPCTSIGPDAHDGLHAAIGPAQLDGGIAGSGPGSIEVVGHRTHFA